MKSGVRHSRLDRQKETLVWKKRRKQRLLSASIVPSRWDMKTKKPRDTKTKSAPSSACAKAQLSVPVLLRGFGRTYNTFTDKGTFSFIFELLVPDDDVIERMNVLSISFYFFTDAALTHFRVRRKPTWRVGFAELICGRLYISGRGPAFENKRTPHPCIPWR